MFKEIGIIIRGCILDRVPQCVIAEDLALGISSQRLQTAPRGLRLELLYPLTTKFKS